MIVEALAVLAAIISAVYIVALVLFLVPARKVAEKKDLPLVSIMIATKNEENVIEKTLKSLRRLDYSKFEIIVIDSSTDSTPKIAKKYADKVIIDKSGCGKPHAMNIGLRQAKGEVIYVVDADSVASRSALKQLLHALDGEYDAVVGVNLPGNSQSVTAYVSRLELGFLNLVNKTFSIARTAMIPGRNYIIYKKTLEKAGGFENVLTEDVNLSWRLFAEKKKVDLAEAVCREQVPDKASWYFRQQERWTVGTFSEIRPLIGRLPLVDSLIFLPAILLLGGLPSIMVVSLALYAITLNAAFIFLFAVSFLVMLAAAVKYLSARDIVLFPVIAILFGIFEFASIFIAGSVVSRRKKLGWYKTPKEKVK